MRDEWMPGWSGKQLHSLGAGPRALETNQIAGWSEGLAIMPTCTEMARAWGWPPQETTDLPSNGEESSKDAEI